MQKGPNINIKFVFDVMVHLDKKKQRGKSDLYASWTFRAERSYQIRRVNHIHPKFLF